MMSLVRNKLTIRAYFFNFNDSDQYNETSVFEQFRITRRKSYKINFVLKMTNLKFLDYVD